MRKILVSALAVGATAAAGAVTPASAEPASGPVALSPAELDAVKGGIRDIRRSFNNNTISSVSNGNIRQGNANTTVGGSGANEVTGGNFATTTANLQVNLNNVVLDASTQAPPTTPTE